ncbi:MAG: AAA family ATPase, partial [Ignavibacteria bacterium]|nr:AAA family ATPase [Ignavibacteria bacterium]
MGKVIALVNHKGGCAKTTTSLLLAWGLYHRNNNYKILLVDLDPQRNLSRWLKAKTEDVPSTFELLTGEAKAEEVIQSLECFDIMPASKDLARAEIALPLTGKLKRLKKGLAQVKQLYDWVIVDTGPNLGVLSLNALIAADEVLIPS